MVSDRACDVEPYARRIGNEGSQVRFYPCQFKANMIMSFKVCKFYAEKLKWAVDKFHIKGHTEKGCKLR